MATGPTDPKFVLRIDAETGRAISPTEWSEYEWVDVTAINDRPDQRIYAKVGPRQQQPHAPRSAAGGRGNFGNS